MNDLSFSYNNTKIKYIILLLYFLAGAGIVKGYIVMLVVYIVFTGKYFFAFHKNKIFSIFYLTLNGFVVSLFLIGMDRLTQLKNPTDTFIIWELNMLMLTYIAYKEGAVFYIEILYGFLFGIFIVDSIVVLYNINTSASFSGYGNLLNPITGDVSNSPSYSNDFAIIFCGFFGLYANTKYKLLKIFSVSIIIISTISGVFLGGRVFFIVIALFLGIYLFYKKKINTSLGIMILIIASCLYYMISNSYAELIINRFNDQGSESIRYELWESGLNNLLEYPLGGSSINSFIYEGYSYHNLWLDVAMFAGWLPLFLLLIINSFIIYLYKKVYNKGFVMNVFILIAVLCLIVMGQDVIVEGNMKIFAYYSIINAVIFSYINQIEEDLSVR